MLPIYTQNHPNSFYFLPILSPLLRRVSSSLWQRLVQTSMISHHTFTEIYLEVL